MCVSSELNEMVLLSFISFASHTWMAWPNCQKGTFRAVTAFVIVRD